MIRKILSVFVYFLICMFSVLLVSGIVCLIVRLFTKDFVLNFTISMTSGCAVLMVADLFFRTQDRFSNWFDNYYAGFFKQTPPEVLAIAFTIIDRLQECDHGVVEHLTTDFYSTPHPTYIVKEVFHGGQVVMVVKMSMGLLAYGSELALAGTNDKLRREVGAYIKKHHGAGLTISYPSLNE